MNTTLLDRSYITHQRRPALIPLENGLSPAEELEVRLRTGNIMHHGPSSSQPTTSWLPSTGAAQPRSSAKRKASTAAEDYHSNRHDVEEQRQHPQCRTRSQSPSRWLTPSQWGTTSFSGYGRSIEQSRKPASRTVANVLAYEALLRSNVKINTPPNQSTTTNVVTAGQP